VLYEKIYKKLLNCQLAHCMSHIVHFRNKPLFPQSCRTYEHTNDFYRRNKCRACAFFHETKHQGGSQLAKQTNGNRTMKYTQNNDHKLLKMVQTGYQKIHLNNRVLLLQMKRLKWCCHENAAGALYKSSGYI